MSKHLAIEKLMDAEVIAQAGTAYSNSTKYRSSTGNAGVLVVSSAGSVTVTQQCSLDNITWYDPVNGANSALGAIATTMTVGSRYVIPSLVVAPYIRIKVVETNVAGTTASVTLVYQEDATH